MNNIGQQTSFPVQQGILDYQGTNWLRISLWAIENRVAKLSSLVLEADGHIGTLILPAMTGVEVVPRPGWTLRPGAY